MSLWPHGLEVMEGIQVPVGRSWPWWSSASSPCVSPPALSSWLELWDHRPAPQALPCSKHLQPRIPVGSSLCSGTLGNEMFFPGDFFGCKEFRKPLDFLLDFIL